MDSIWGLIALACGLYCLTGYWKMKKKGEIFKSVLLPREVDLKDCKNLEAYRKEAEPKVLLLGVVLLLWGVCDLLCTKFGIDEMVVFWIAFAVVFVVLIWFVAATSRLRKKYFS